MEPRDRDKIIRLEADVAQLKRDSINGQAVQSQLDRLEAVVYRLGDHVVEIQKLRSEERDDNRRVMTIIERCARACEDIAAELHTSMLIVNSNTQTSAEASRKAADAANKAADNTAKHLLAIGGEDSHKHSKAWIPKMAHAVKDWPVRVWLGFIGVLLALAIVGWVFFLIENAHNAPKILPSPTVEEKK